MTVDECEALVAGNLIATDSGIFQVVDNDLDATKICVATVSSKSGEFHYDALENAVLVPASGGGSGSGGGTFGDWQTCNLIQTNGENLPCQWREEPGGVIRVRGSFYAIMSNVPHIDGLPAVVSNARFPVVAQSMDDQSYSTLAAQIDPAGMITFINTTVTPGLNALIWIDGIAYVKA